MKMNPLSSTIDGDVIAPKASSTDMIKKNFFRYHVLLLARKKKKKTLPVLSHRGVYNITLFHQRILFDGFLLFQFISDNTLDTMATNSIKLLTGNSHPELARLVADR